jgi:hypothetical protein
MLLMTASLLSAAGCMSSAGTGGTSGGVADLIPGHHDEVVRKQAAADSFPSAAQALHTPAPQGGN